MEEKNVKQNSKIKYVHIGIIVLGIIFISLSIFHTSLWFDETYSVALAKYSFVDIWQIGANDVHPILYYFGLHLLNLIFGNNIIVYRIFSMLAIAILGIFGYTHIRKDFGERVGLLFSFFVFFLPINCVYSGEVRMYTWAMLFVSLIAIYAYRIYKEIFDSNKEKQSNKINKNKIKNWALFAVFSLASCYTHYYGLVAAGIINLVLFIYLITKAIKNHKQDKENKLYTTDLKCFTVSAIAQIILYLPWLICAISQLNKVSKGFWIQTPSVDLWLQIFRFQFTGDLGEDFISKKISVALGITLLLYTVYSIVRMIYKNKGNKLQNSKQEEKNKENSKTKNKDLEEYSKAPGLWAIGIYALVTIAIFIISLVKVPILYARYFLNLTGLFIFFLAFFIGKGGRKWITVIICVATMAIASNINYQMQKINYDKSNSEPLAYIQTDLQESDMLFWANTDWGGFVISTQLENQSKCFYDKKYWNQEAAYEAFGKDMKTIKKVEEIKDYQGRIWIVGSWDFEIYNELVREYGEDVKLIKQKSFETKYHQYGYTLTLVEKVK